MWKRTIVFGRALATVLALPVTAVLAEPFSVELSVQETRGVARIAEPISGGLPLPKGLFPANQPFSLVRTDGTEVS
jgi:hypothetical protein